MDAATLTSLTTTIATMSAGQQLVLASTFLFAGAFAILYWTAAGNRALVVKSGVMALVLHALAWGYVTQFDLAPKGPELETTAPVVVHLRPLRQRVRTPRLLNDPRGASLSAPSQQPMERMSPSEQQPERSLDPVSPQEPDLPARTGNELSVPDAEVKEFQRDPSLDLPAAQGRDATARADELPVFRPSEQLARRASTPSRDPVAAVNPSADPVRRSSPSEEVVRDDRPEVSFLPRLDFRLPTHSAPDSKKSDSEAKRGEFNVSFRRTQPSAGPIRRRTADVPSPSESPAIRGPQARRRSVTQDMAQPLASRSVPPIASGTRKTPGPLAAAPAPSPPSGSTGGRQRGSGDPKRRMASTSSAIGGLVPDAAVRRRRSNGGAPTRRITQQRREPGNADAGQLVARTRRNPLGSEKIAALGSAPSLSKSFWSNRAAANRLDLVFRYGGSLETEKAVADALQWLAEHQHPDGFWDSDRFFDQCPQGRRCSGAAIERGSDTGLTGLALLAFLGANHTHQRPGKHRETVLGALQWLHDVQRNDGDLRGNGRVYCHAMATLALTEAYAMTKDPALRTTAQRAVSWLIRAQHPESGGWRYGPGQFGDTSVYGWCVLSLRSAKRAGLRVPDDAWQRAQRWLPLVSAGRDNGLATYRPGDSVSAAMTAEALVCRQIFGLRRSDPAMNEAGRYMLSRLPDPNAYNLYYWYYGTLSMFQLGDVYWQRWNEALSATLLTTQQKSGHQKGSWDPQRPWGVDGGRVFTTACSALCLEVYYRYVPLYATSGNPRQ